MTDTKGQIKYIEGEFMEFGRWQAILPAYPDRVFCTNEKGEGLFIQWRDSGKVGQLQGLGQFMPKSFDHFKRMIRSIRIELANAES
jgi:hypothetical protein